MKRKIAFFFFENRDINTYPSITNALRILREHDFTVDVYLNSAMQTSLEIPGVNFIIVSELDPYQYVLNSVKYIESRQITYDFIMAFQFEALIISYMLNRFKKRYIPTAYFSMELIYNLFLLRLSKKVLRYFLGRKNKDSFKYIWLQFYVWVWMHLFGRRQIHFSIVQDVDRGNVLTKQFSFLKNVVYLPNSYIGFSDESSNFIHERFGIPKDKKVVLFTGGVERGFDLAFFDLARDLSDEYVLFLNVFSRDNYLQEILPHYQQEIKSGRLYINDINLNEDDYDKLVKNSYICVAWYAKPSTNWVLNPNDINMYFLGLSSGKLNKYLACGKPVIAPGYFHLYPQLIEGNGLGKTCERAGEIPALLQYIEENYSVLHSNVKKFYNEHLEYKDKFQFVIKEIYRSIGVLPEIPEYN